MCQWGNQELITITTKISVDPCLAQEVLLLNDRGIRTEASCCGHNGKSPPSILFPLNERYRQIAEYMGYDPVEYSYEGGKPYAYEIIPKSECIQPLWKPLTNP